MGEVGKGLEYIKSPGALLKVAELALLLIAIGAVGHFLKEGPKIDYEKKDRIEFFVAATVITSAVVICFFLIFLTGIHKKCKLAWSKTAAGVYLLMGIFVFVASAMLAEAYKSYKDKFFCDGLKISNSKAQCKHLLIGLVCGFITSVVLVADAIVHFRM